MYNFTMKKTTPNPPPWAAGAKHLMSIQGITQEDLTGVFEVTTRGAVGHYFSGRRPAKEYQIRKLAEILGTTISEIYEPENFVQRNKPDRNLSKLQIEAIELIKSMDNADVKPFVDMLKKFVLARSQ